MPQTVKQLMKARGASPDDQPQQPIASVAKKVVLLMYLATFSRITGCSARDISVECTPIDAGFCALTEFCFLARCDRFHLHIWPHVWCSLKAKPNQSQFGGNIAAF